MAYTDSEIDGLDESTITPYLKNELSGSFDQAVAASNIIEHNLSQNFITFNVESFSTYGLGAQAVSVPVDSNTKEMLLVLILCVLGSAFVLRMSARLRH